MKTTKKRASTSAKSSAAGKSDDSPYHLRISRLTVDKLGVKLYDNASAVVAELIANCYDADAETATVRIPLNVHLATIDNRRGSGRVSFIDVGEDFVEFVKRGFRIADLHER